MSLARQDALAALREAIKTAGGSVAVAARAGIPQTHLSTVANGKRPMGRDTASKLRPHVELDAAAWVELLAPIPESPAETAATAEASA